MMFDFLMIWLVSSLSTLKPKADSDSDPEKSPGFDPDG